MLKLVVQTFLTLDGVYQAPGGPKEDTSGGFKHGGWQMPFFDADCARIMDQQMAEIDAALLGRVTYQIFAGFWPKQPDSDPMAKKFNAIPRFVFSNTLKTSDWRGTTILSGSLVEGVRQAKQSPGSGIVGVPGSGVLAQALMKQGLVDELRLWIHPIVLGSGKRLFPDGFVPLHIKLVDSKTTASGVTVVTYRPEK